MLSRHLMVSVQRVKSAAKVPVLTINQDHIIITGTGARLSEDHYVVDPTWYAQSLTAREVLSEYGKSIPIIVSSVGYHFGVGYQWPAHFSKMFRMSVPRLCDFNALWHSFSGKMGLRGCQSIEWRPMPSPSGRPSYFAFFTVQTGRQCLSDRH